jgi:Lrp/AsnC family transcriptional regulator for asnA, asnC and gidA
MYKIDKNDVRIINLLLEDGRMPASEISRQLDDISERVVRYRIDRMIEEGIISVSAIVKPEAFGLDTYADVWLEVESDKILEVAKTLTKYENVTYVSCAIGETDVNIQVVSKDAAEIYQFMTEVVRKIPGVRRTVTSIVPIILKDIYQWRIPEGFAEDE